MGEEPLVPLAMRYAVSEVLSAPPTLVPGANRSTQLPKLLNDDRVSVISVAPTEIANAAEAGEFRQAAVADAAFPAAATTTKPSRNNCS